MRNMVDGLWLSATWVERLRIELGLAGIHQVWDERPAWYVWLVGDPGAYGLELLHAEQDDGLIHGLFGIKYYPSPGNGLWEAFSDEERNLVVGVRFDRSVTPTFEAREDIPPHLFQVGALEITTNPTREWCCFGLSALSSCSWMDADGALLRNPPGWALSYALAERLLGLHAYASKHTPVLAAFSQEPGLEVMAREDGQSLTRPCGSNQAYNLNVLFGPEPGRAPLSKEVWQELLPSASEKSQTWEREFSCRHYHPWEVTAEKQPVLSSQWWHLAEVGYTSELATSCGCEHC
ncbi:MAG: hypothetical protein KQI62_10870 [Deltaproteobacteria bacterium]|nr:hypothetical protein [Deltaproteobacteria bacterium]